MTDPDATCHQRLPLDDGLPCGHPYWVHEHMTPWKSHCGECACPGFKGAPILVRVARWLRGLR